jgi:hypothetical protein
MRKNITQSALNSWTTAFQDKKYRGSWFLQIKRYKGEHTHTHIHQWRYVAEIGGRGNQNLHTYV